MKNPGVFHESGAGSVLLSSLLPGEQGRIIAVGMGMGRQHHLRRMGLREGKIVTVIATQPAHGPFVLEIDGAQIAIGRGMALHILVEKV
ncbi:MAG TPA: ferrous iron transport protein A [Methanomicrobia archaeon]|nr:ferrous iron transport protein A [Methanomicrobia archaeon]